VLAHGRRPGSVLAAALLCGGWALVVWNGWWHSDGTGVAGHVLTDLPAAAGFAAVIAVVAARPPGLLATAPMRALGALSYGLYLWHMPVLLALRLHGAFPRTALAALPAVLLPTLALAAASCFLVERPVLRWVERACRREREVRGRTRLGAPATELAD